MTHADLELAAYCRELGFVQVPGRNGKHQVWRHPNGATLVTSRSMGRGRGLANAKSRARRLSRSA